MFELLMMLAIVGAFVLGRFARWRHDKESCKIALPSVAVTAKGSSFAAKEMVVNQSHDTGWPKK